MPHLFYTTEYFRSQLNRHKLISLRSALSSPLWAQPRVTRAPGPDHPGHCSTSTSTSGPRIVLIFSEAHLPSPLPADLEGEVKARLWSQGRHRRTLQLASGCLVSSYFTLCVCVLIYVDVMKQILRFYLLWRHTLELCDSVSVHYLYNVPWLACLGRVD